MQSPYNKHLRVAFCFPITSPDTPIEELAWTFHHNVTKAPRMKIQRQNSCLLSMVSFPNLMSHR